MVIDPDTAQRIQPRNPENSCYSKAAKILAGAGIECRRHESDRIQPDALRDVDAFVILHPCAEFEETTEIGSAQYTDAEIETLCEFVQNGGSLWLVGEYEQSKYRTNLDVIASRFGLKFMNNTVTDPEHHHSHPAWVFSDPTRSVGAAFCRVSTACFYRSGSIMLDEPSDIRFRPTIIGGLRLHESASAHFADFALVALSCGRGRVLAQGDSDIFGDERIDDFDNVEALLASAYCLIPYDSTSATTGRSSSVAESASRVDSWFTGKIQPLVDDLREWQASDGSIHADKHPEAREIVQSLMDSLSSYPSELTHQSQYFDALRSDFGAWLDSSFDAPSFDSTVRSFNPIDWANNGFRIFVAIFPCDTPNSSKEYRFEAIQGSFIWPDWIRQLNLTRFQHHAFISASLDAYTEGYNSHCAVLFPSSVSANTNGKPEAEWGIIFASREARRAAAFTRVARTLVNSNCPLMQNGFSQITLASWRPLPSGIFSMTGHISEEPLP